MEMKTENLIREMNASEMDKVNGGIGLGELFALASLCVYLYNEGGDFVEGFKEGYND